MEIELKKNSKKTVNDYQKIWYKNFYLIDKKQNSLIPTGKPVGFLATDFMTTY